jgi:hypothetical protein
MPDEQDLAEAGHTAEAANTALLIPCVRVKIQAPHLSQESMTCMRVLC